MCKRCREIETLKINWRLKGEHFTEIDQFLGTHGAPGDVELVCFVGTSLSAIVELGDAIV